jgi:hypothetical protein
MDINGFVKKLRMFLADPEGKIWDDVEINTLLNEALKQYCKDSGAFTGSFDFYPDKNGTYHYPDDYADFMIGWNTEDQEITPATARELFVRSCRDVSRTGEPEYIFDDLDSCGSFSLYPVPEAMQNRKDITITPDFGEISDSQYGVFAADAYGTTLSVDVFDFAGTIIYRRTGNFEEVKDYMAVICYALNLAYCADSEFANPELAAYWKNMYRSRIAVFGRVAHENTGRTVSGNFY